VAELDHSVDKFARRNVSLRIRANYLMHRLGARFWLSYGLVFGLIGLIVMLLTVYSL